MLWWEREEHHWVSGKCSRKEPGMVYIFVVQKLRCIVEDRKLSGFAVSGN